MRSAMERDPVGIKPAPATPKETPMNTATTRLEHDLLGDKEVPTAAYYGVHTLRALENFPITGITIAVYPDLIRALAQIKRRPPRPTASWACSTRSG
jgi:hypothetical protein